MLLVEVEVVFEVVEVEVVVEVVVMVAMVTDYDLPPGYTGGASVD
jgi:hypothetical protein